MQFTPGVATVLRNANRRLTSVPPGDLVEPAEACFQAMLALAPVDSFYVGCYQPRNVVRMTYVYDGDRILGPDLVPFGAHGVSARVRTGVTYRWADDGGALLGRGVSFGDTARPTRDCVVAPIKGRTGDVLGLIGFLSYRPGVFTDELVAAAQWLADAYAVNQAWSQDYLHHINHSAVSAAPMSLSPSEALLQAEKKLVQLGDRLRLLRCDEPVAPGLRTDLTELCAQALDVARRADESAAAQSDLGDLTDRERQIALMIRDGLTNAQIAARLHLAERTIKGHVTNILAKVGAERRTQI